MFYAFRSTKMKVIFSPTFFKIPFLGRHGNAAVLFN